MVKASGSAMARRGILRGLGVVLILVIWVGRVFTGHGAELQIPLHPPMDGFRVVSAFPGLKFNHPLGVVSPPGETNRLFVVEKEGRVWVITNLANPTTTLFLDLGPELEAVSLREPEWGLLSMAFHPGYATNGYFFIYRTDHVASPVSPFAAHDILSRFSVSPNDPNKALRESEVHFIVQIDGSPAHNGGEIQFGPDGYLYLSIGCDSPQGDDISQFPQAIDKSLMGSIIRIDVDKRPGNLPPTQHPSASSNYFIPRDNPFVGATSFEGRAVDPARVRTELYAIGFRNPWRFTIHPQTGAILAGDVGSALYEELNVVTKGGNYGWPYFEGNSDFVPRPAGFTGIPSLVLLTHGGGTNEASCVVGGVFYMGSKIPALRGKYVFGDYRFGNIFALDSDGVSFSSNAVRIASSRFLVSFGRDPRDNEILLANIERGEILKLEYGTPETAASFPQTIEETGVFTNLTTLAVNPALIPYEINHSFWSDHAIKHRWFIPPPSGEKLRFTTNDFGTFPKGSVWVKHFEMEMQKGNAQSRRRLETRLLVKTNEGIYGVTYKWNAAGTQATLVPDEGTHETLTIDEGGGNFRTQVWRYPARSECRDCHTDEAGQALGFHLAQLNMDVPSASGLTNQVLKWRDAGYVQLDGVELTQRTAMAGINDESRSLRERGRSFFAANCVPCHHGPENNWDTKWSTRMSIAAFFEPRPVLATDLSQSYVYHRLATTDLFRMPPFGRNVPDTNAIEVVRRWMASMPKAPWMSSEIGASGAEGDSAMENGILSVNGGGMGMRASGDSLQFLSMSASNNVVVVVKFLGQTNRMNRGSAGLMLRSSKQENAAFVSIGASYGGTLGARRGRDGATAALSNLPAIADGSWLRLEKKGGAITASVSTDGVQWTTLQNFEVDLGSSFQAGIFSHSDGVGPLNYARFENFQLASVEMTKPAALETTFLASDRIELGARQHIYPTGPSLMHYYANGQKIGESTAEGFQFVWTNLVAGDYQVSARLVANGVDASSAARFIHVLPPPPRALYRTNFGSPFGAWEGTLGKNGYILPGVATNLPSYATVEIDGGIRNWPEMRGVSRALVPPGGGVGEGNEWIGTPVKVRLRLTDSVPHHLSLYFVDWYSQGFVQRVDVKSLTDGTLFHSQVISNFAGGRYLQWRVSGAVEVTITRLNGLHGTLVGVFLDPTTAGPPTARMISPVDQFAVQVPQVVTLEAEANWVDGDVPRLEFFANNTRITALNQPPYRFTWDNALAGNYSIFARVTDRFGLSSDSTPVTLRLTSPEGAAVFLRSDDATRGNWIGRYGSAGYQMLYNATNLPRYATIEFPGEAAELLLPMEQNDERGTLTPNGASRATAVVSGWAAFKSIISFKDGLAHRFSLYFLDSPGQGWELMVRLKNRSGSVLDERILGNYKNGRYLSWLVRGDIVLELERRSGPFAGVSGFFFDEMGISTATVSLNAPAEGGSFPFGQNVLFHAEVAPPGADVGQVEFFANDLKIGEALRAPYYLRWAPPVGENAVRARVVEWSGVGADSNLKKINVTRADAPAAAIFSRMDEFTAGNWRGNFGNEGYSIPGVGVVAAPRAAVTLRDAQTLEWDLHSENAAALQKTFGIERVAAAYSSSAPFEIDLASSDNAWRTVSFYVLDWNGNGSRAQSISLLDGGDRRVLDQQSVSDFAGGKYYSWKVRGNVVARFESAGTNAVVSGVFIDPISNYEQWRLNHFFDDSILSNDWEDPDEDGIPNLLEYKLGLDPLMEDNAPVMVSALEDGEARLKMGLNPEAEDVALVFEVSNDLVNWTAANELISTRSLLPGQARDSVEFQVDDQDQNVMFVRFRGSRGLDQLAR